MGVWPTGHWGTREMQGGSETLMECVRVPTSSWPSTLSAHCRFTAEPPTPSETRLTLFKLSLPLLFSFHHTPPHPPPPPPLNRAPAFQFKCNIRPWSCWGSALVFSVNHLICRHAFTAFITQTCPKLRSMLRGGALLVISITRGFLAPSVKHHSPWSLSSSKRDFYFFLTLSFNIGRTDSTTNVWIARRQKGRELPMHKGKIDIFKEGVTTKGKLHSTVLQQSSLNQYCPQSALESFWGFHSSLCKVQPQSTLRVPDKAKFSLAMFGDT